MEARMIDASTDAAIATYRAKLAAAGVSAADLDELTEHLGALTEELCATGLAPADAVAEAMRRLGEPRCIAREHVRVRSEFGPKPSRLRAWSAAVLLLAGFGPAVYSLLEYALFRAGPIPDLTGEQLIVLGVVIAPWVLLVVALARRAPWAPAVVLGALLPILVGVYASGGAAPSTSGGSPGFALGVFSTVAFPACALLVLPWRRAEITLRSVAAMLFTCSIFVFPSQTELVQIGSDASVASGLTMVFAYICAVSAVMRAPWLTFVGTCAVVTALTTVVAAWSTSGISLSSRAAATSATLALATATALSWYAAHRRARTPRVRA
jgi:hypothetical protein